MALSMDYSILTIRGPVAATHRTVWSVGDVLGADVFGPFAPTESKMVMEDLHELRCDPLNNSKNLQLSNIDDCEYEMRNFRSRAQSFFTELGLEAEVGDVPLAGFVTPATCADVVADGSLQRTLTTLIKASASTSVAVVGSVGYSGGGPCRVSLNALLPPPSSLATSDELEENGISPPPNGAVRSAADVTARLVAAAEEYGQTMATAAASAGDAAATTAAQSGARSPGAIFMAAADASPTAEMRVRGALAAAAAIPAKLRVPQVGAADVTADVAAVDLPSAGRDGTAGAAATGGDYAVGAGVLRPVPVFIPAPPAAFADVAAMVIDIVEAERAAAAGGSEGGATRRGRGRGRGHGDGIGTAADGVAAVADLLTRMQGIAAGDPLSDDTDDDTNGDHNDGDDVAAAAGDNPMSSRFPRPPAINVWIVGAEFGTSSTFAFKQLAARGSRCGVGLVVAPAALLTQPIPRDPAGWSAMPSYGTCVNAIIAALSPPQAEDALMRSGGRAISLSGAVGAKTQMRRYGGPGLGAVGGGSGSGAGGGSLTTMLRSYGVPSLYLAAACGVSVASSLGWWAPPPPEAVVDRFWTCDGCASTNKEPRSAAKDKSFRRGEGRYCSMQCLKTAAPRPVEAPVAGSGSRRGAGPERGNVESLAV